MTFTTGVLLIVSVQSQEKALDRKALEWLREDYEAVDGRFSPDGRFLAFLSNEMDVRTMQAYVRPFNSAKPNAPAGPAVQVTNIKTGINAARWRRDGKELFVLTRDREIMVVDVTSTTPFKAGSRVSCLR